MSTCTNARAIRQILCAIDKTVNCMNVPGFSVDVEITTNNGVIYEVTFSSGLGDGIKITDSCLITDDATISLNYISKIVIESSQVSQALFMGKLTCEIYRIMKGVGCCQDAGEAVACLQKFINCNKLDIEAVNYNGGMETIQTVAAVTDIVTTDVVQSASLATTSQNININPVLTTTPVDVAGTVTVSDQDVVTAVAASPTTVATGVSQTTVATNPPITVTSQDVVTGITAGDAGPIVTSVTSTQTTVNSVGTITPQSAATGFDTFTTVSGVIGGITAATNTTTTQFEYTPVTVTGTGTSPTQGTLQVVVPANAFGEGVPSAAVTLNVVVEGNTGTTVAVGESSDIYAFDSSTNVLTGVTGTPTVNDLSIPATLTTAQVVGSVATNSVTVAGPITTTTSQGSIVTDIQTGTVNNPTVSDPINVVNSVTATTGSINALGTVSTQNLQELVTVANQSVTQSATIATTPVSVVTSAALTTTDATVVEQIDTSTISVCAPVNEQIEGSVVCAGNGIMTVENDNGNVSLYNICDINAVETTD